MSALAIRYLADTWLHAPSVTPGVWATVSNDDAPPLTRCMLSQIAPFPCPAANFTHAVIW